MPIQQLRTAKLLRPGSLAWTSLVAPIGLVPAAENPQALGFRLSRFLRLWLGGLSRRLLSMFQGTFLNEDRNVAWMVKVLLDAKYVTQLEL